MPPQLFLDLDGVLGDFYGHCRTQLGEEFAVDQEDPTELFRRIRKHGNFYRTQPLLPDALVLWDSVKHLKPIILSGIPYSVPNVAFQKRGWVDEYLGRDVPLVCCRSQDKYHYGLPGDILVDDRIKYSHFWLSMGGVFVWHKSAIETLMDLSQWLPGSITGAQGTVFDGPVRPL
jgi:hypothetical protein